MIQAKVLRIDCRSHDQGHWTCMVWCRTGTWTHWSTKMVILVQDTVETKRWWMTMTQRWESGAANQSARYVLLCALVDNHLDALFVQYVVLRITELSPNEKARNCENRGRYCIVCSDDGMDGIQLYFECYSYSTSNKFVTTILEAWWSRTCWTYGA